MPVIFKSVVKGYSPSNKSSKTKDKHAWAYMYDMPGTGKVHVRVPVIDKISLTVPVQKPSVRHQILETLKTAETGKLSKYFTKAWKWPARKDYWIAINCTTTKGETLLVQASHKKLKSHLLRLEFNPAKQGEWGLAFVKSWVSELTAGLFDWAYVVENARATRLDVAVDLINAPMTDLVVTSHVPGKNHIYVSEAGDVETVYLGIPETDKPTEQLVYDKLQHASDKKYKPLYDGINHSRAEVIVKSSNLKFSNIATIQNPLHRLSLAHPGEPPTGVDPLTWKLFLETCRYRGTNGALFLLPNDLVPVFQQELDAASELCWRPDKLWSHWPMTVKSSGLLGPE